MSDTTYSYWYRLGSATVQNGSKKITGQNSYWGNASIKPGDIFTIDGSKLYEIDTVDNDTQITLKTPYLGETQSAIGYAVIRNFTATLTAEIAAKVCDIVNKHERYVDNDMATVQGKSSYELAVENGFVGTLEEFLQSETAYGAAVSAGYTGSFDDWINALTSDFAELEGIRADITTAQGDITTLKSNTTTNANNITALQTRASNIEQDATTLTGRVKSNEDNITALNTRAGNIEKAAETLTGRVETNEGEITNLHGTDYLNPIYRVKSGSGYTSHYAHAHLKNAVDYCAGYISVPKVTDEMWASLKAGTFEGWHIGMQIGWMDQVDGMRNDDNNYIRDCYDNYIFLGTGRMAFYVADLNYFYRNNYTETYTGMTNHAVIFVRNNFGAGQSQFLYNPWVSKDMPATSGGYVNSLFRSSSNRVLYAIADAMKLLFGEEHIFTSYHYLSPAAVNDTTHQVTAYADTTGIGVELPSLDMLGIDAKGGAEPIDNLEYTPPKMKPLAICRDAQQGELAGLSATPSGRTANAWCATQNTNSKARNKMIFHATKTGLYTENFSPLIFLK